MSNKTFKDLGISQETLKSLEDLGYSKPTEIQEKAIPAVLSGKDLVAQAQTGTGKTAAFGIPIVESVNTKQKKIQALVLVPTRELAIQVAKEIKDLGKNKKVFVLSVYGGKSMKHQIDFLKKGNDVVIVGTPGRVKDLLERGFLKLDNVKMFVLDEADRMLEMGFIEDIEDIMSYLPEDRQNLLFSATMPKEILELAQEFLNEDYQTIKVKPDEITVEKIKQIIYRVDPKNKFNKLIEVLSQNQAEKTIIFTQTKLEADQLSEDLSKEGFSVSAIHGDFSQKKRETVLHNFRTGKLKILVATDVAARGLDIKGVELVINYGLPKNAESYVHRIGRTGRAGKEGTAISIPTPSEDKYLQQILQKTKANIEVINEASEKKFTKKETKKSSFNSRRISSRR
ncbi:DEAD/DEAH box helicase [Sulfurihydrogenibium azorense]|uniref:DEAD-box ATP-dependent RNA helicase RhpA n=1 Tax=Sulfurihydrogenibium azorense (strain DSM 15241 / OCM 825 / Az-Fu1) TaxID=204536 RepID=C1DWE1_SULAA|nr:DEAD/DEAH box helicase [Sulfurihydrogenibium azorense]ACN99115.1 ATP-dependent RNA helicase DbpA [Sulfurihydrogenibium azorense Az-Fu1]